MWEKGIDARKLVHSKLPQCPLSVAELWFTVIVSNVMDFSKRQDQCCKKRWSHVTYASAHFTFVPTKAYIGNKYLVTEQL